MCHLIPQRNICQNGGRRRRFHLIDVILIARLRSELLRCMIACSSTSLPLWQMLMYQVAQDTAILIGKIPLYSTRYQRMTVDVICTCLWALWNIPFFLLQQFRKNNLSIIDYVALLTFNVLLYVAIQGLLGHKCTCSVLVSLCFRENVIVACKILSFCCSLDDFLLKM